MQFVHLLCGFSINRNDDETPHPYGTDDYGVLLYIFYVYGPWTPFCTVRNHGPDHHDLCARIKANTSPIL
ncbi:hypothetical protein D3C84_1126720 [compost metagenome]